VSGASGTLPPDRQRETLACSRRCRSRTSVSAPEVPANAIFWLAGCICVDCLFVTAPARMGPSRPGAIRLGAIRPGAIRLGAIRLGAIRLGAC